MEKIKMLRARRILKIFMWVFLILIALFIVAVIVRIFQLRDLEKTKAEVFKIHATKLTLDDVMGKNLPPDPGVLADQTVEGVDANNNGIRDDVELAVFKSYPNSAKTRAVLLQYALVLQIEDTQKIATKEIATAVSEEDSRSYDCIGSIVSKGNGDIQKIESYRNFVESRQINTTERKKVKTNFDNQTGSFELQLGCDVNLKTLPN